MERLVDTNMIIRYLVNDIPEQGKEAYNIMKAGFKVYPEILSEVIYVLDGVYNCSRKDIEYGLSEIMDSAEMDEKNVYEEALSIYAKTSFDFIDAVLIARNQIYGDRVFTFDKKLKNKVN